MRMENTISDDGCIIGVALHLWPCPWWMGTAAMPAVGLSRGSVNAHGWGGGPVLCHTEGYCPVALPAVGEQSALHSPVHQPYGPFHSP